MQLLDPTATVRWGAYGAGVGCASCMRGVVPRSGAPRYGAIPMHDCCDKRIFVISD